MANPWEELQVRGRATKLSLDPWVQNQSYSIAQVSSGTQNLMKHYYLNDYQRECFARDRYIRLDKVLCPSVLVQARQNLQALANSATNGTDVSSPNNTKRPSIGSSQEENETWWSSISEPIAKSWNMQQMWTVNECIRSIVLAPRIGTIVCQLLGCKDVRLYHDNALSRAPGSRGTRWHCDDGPNGYMIMSGFEVVTIWIPLQHTRPSMGSLVFARRPCTPNHLQLSELSDRRDLDLEDVNKEILRPVLDSWGISDQPSMEFRERSDEYDQYVSHALEADGCVPDEHVYELGDISIHRTNCYHRTGPNLACCPRMILAATYCADGTTARCDINKDSLPRAQRIDWEKFAPGVMPGTVVDSKFNPILAQAVE